MVDSALDLSNGLVIGQLPPKRGNRRGDETFSTSGLCPQCNQIMPVLDMRSFSFNSPYGACPRCTGLGIPKK